SGALHLQITRTGDTWTSVELDLDRETSFGTYQVYVLGQPAQLDPNAVFGFFAYPPADVGPDGTNEIDIEIARWGNPRSPNGNFTVWPTTLALMRSSSQFEIGTMAGGTSTYRFTWGP